MLEYGAIAVVHDRAARPAEAEPVDLVPAASLGDLKDREIKLLTRDKVESGGRRETLLWLHCDLGADHADLKLRVGVLQRFGDSDIGGEGRGRGVQHREFVFARERQHVVELEARRWRVDQLAAWNEGSRLGQPGRIPERADLAPCLVTRAGAAIEAVERRRVEEQGLH